MNPTHLSLPNIANSDVEFTVVNRWDVGTCKRQGATVDAVVAAWAERPWPEALITFTCLSSTDGATVVSYAQWASEEAASEFMASHPPAGVDALATAVPGIGTSLPATYRRYRSITSHTSRPPVCVVMVRLGADDPASARRWIDALIEGIESEPTPIPGLVAAHFHIDAAGTSIVNLAEWVDEQAHRRAVDGGDIEGIGQTASAAWSRVLAMPHVTPLALEYYRLGHAVLYRQKGGTR